MTVTLKSKVTKNRVKRISHPQITLDITDIDPDQSGLDKSFFKGSYILADKIYNIRYRYGENGVTILKMEKKFCNIHGSMVKPPPYLHDD